MNVRDFEILSDVINGPMHENSQRVSLVVRVDISGPYFKGVDPFASRITQQSKHFK